MNIYRGTNIIASFPVDENTLFFSELMGADRITSNVILDQPITLQIGDFLFWDGNKYYLNDVTDLERNASYAYSITWYGESYLLYNKIVRHLGRTQFGYTGTPTELVLLLLANMRELDPAWDPGEIAEIDEPIHFEIKDQSCRTLLTQVAEEFGLEYYIDGKRINLVERVGEDTGIALQYGRNKGLYTLIRRQLDEGFATVWHGYGGTKNLPVSYREGIGRLTFNQSPVTENLNIYGFIEGVVTFEDIFPQRTAEVEATDSFTEIVDSTLDFDLNALFIVDGGAKIVFKTGDLAGNEFPITNYNHLTKKISFGTNTEDSGYTLPNDVVKAAVGDLYTLVNIEMPSSYILAAEAECKERTEAHAMLNSQPKYAYDAVLDEKYVRDQGIRAMLVPGHRLVVQDPSLAIDELIRIQSVEYPLVNPERITLTISEQRQYTTQERVARDVRQNKKEIKATISSASYAKLAADEIKNYALIHQFQKTYVGDRAVMTGVFVAGNPEDGEVAGVSGVGSLLTSVRFWAGASFAGKESAPFRVQQDGKAFASAMEILNGCKIGVFEISGGFIRSSDYTGAGPTGILISNDGIASRNARASLVPGSSGITMEASFFGSTDKADEAPGFSISESSAGVIAVRWSELIAAALDNLKYSRGVYGLISSSHKNLGAQFDAIRESTTTATVITLTYSDRTVIVFESTTGVNLPSSPDNGMKITIKNACAYALPINAIGTNRIVNLTNNVLSTFSLPSGSVFNAHYQGGVSGRWFII